MSCTMKAVMVRIMMRGRDCLFLKALSMKARMAAWQKGQMISMGKNWGRAFC